MWTEIRRKKKREKSDIVERETVRDVGRERGKMKRAFCGIRAVLARKKIGVCVRSRCGGINRRDLGLERERKGVPVGAKQGETRGECGDWVSMV